MSGLGFPKFGVPSGGPNNEDYKYLVVYVGVPRFLKTTSWGSVLGCCEGTHSNFMYNHVLPA